MIIIIGRNTHTVVMGEDRVVEVANSSAGLEKVRELALSNSGAVQFMGNRRWAIPLASALKERGIEPKYLAVETKAGSRGGFKKTALKFLEQGVEGRPFFLEKRPSGPPPGSNMSWNEAAETYLTAANNVRRAKHNLLSNLSVLFPEVVKPSSGDIKKGRPVPNPAPSDLWTKKMRPVLENPDPFCWDNSTSLPIVAELAQQSLGKFVQASDRNEYRRRYNQALYEFNMAEKEKDKAMEKLKGLVAEHALVKAFPDSEIVVVLAGLVGWREWSNWRELRSYCGLAVTRIDSKGKARTSRVRPHTRMYLYLLATRTKRGKVLAGDATKRIKRIQHLLKKLWQGALRPNADSAVLEVTV
ncbi:TPA: hypothetical protein DEB72_02965 [Patescibacteria group bacterium]|nr:MAG: hypothetical protein UX54_C0012G0002 [Parcubacteria group bacterium GW2011_GWA2_46_39]HBV33453.1 hypothetical protein [Patescibacteria group bacterium]